MLAPGGEQGRLPEPLLTNTFERYWTQFSGRRDGTLEWKNYTPYEWRNVAAFVRLGWRERATEVREWFFGHRAPQPWNQWGEVVTPTPRVPFFLGAGAYRHHVPASVDHLIQRGEFLTSYTPYQPEIAQGTLQVLFEFQTQVARLFGTDVANASMYDGSTACWEAIAMAGRITRRKKAVLSSGLHPHYAATVRTMARL